MADSNDFKALHRLIRFISDLAVHSFFHELRIIGGENVPKNGPIIVTATHHNMMLDPVVLSVGFPYRRMLNYWSKASLFAHPVMSYILFSSGNIPVDRKSKDRQVLFKGTIEALAKGEAVALFPEGTSYTEPRIMQVKDGAAWAAMEYTKWAKENPDKAKYEDVTIVPVSIVYTNKSKYRSRVIMEFGQPIKLDPYKEQFFSDIEGAPRAAVKQVTQRIETELVETSINAPDWDTLYAARMARDLLWEDERGIKTEDFVSVSQTLVDLFTDQELTPNAKAVRQRLLSYYSLLQTSHLSNSVLSSLPLPRTLDPNMPATIPGRLYTVMILIRDTIAALLQLPFFFIPLIVHTPVYIMGTIGARLVKNEEETQAQNKVAFGLISLLFIYPAAFFFLWAMFLYTRIGAFLAALIVYLFAVYHIKMIDGNYERAKRFIAAWRVLVGVWVPKRWDLSSSVVAGMKPKTPPRSAWIDKPSPSAAAAAPTTTEVKSEEETPQKDITDFSLQHEPPVKARSARGRPPSRRLIRHVLRARVEAWNGLAGFFDQLVKEQKKVTSSAHLARAYGDGGNGYGGSGTENLARGGGWRHATEIISYMKKRGARIPTLGHGPLKDEWAAALSSENEGYSTD